MMAKESRKGYQRDHESREENGDCLERKNVGDKMPSYTRALLNPSILHPKHPHYCLELQKVCTFEAPTHITY